MTEVVFMHLCEHAFFDVHGRPCLISVFGADLFARSFPIYLASLTVAIGLRIEPGTSAKTRLEISFAGGPPQRTWNVTTEGPPPELKSDVIAFLPFRSIGMFFTKPGPVVASLFEGDRLLADVRVRITLATSPSPSPLGAPIPPDPR